MKKPAWAGSRGAINGAVPSDGGKSGLCLLSRQSTLSSIFALYISWLWTIDAKTVTDAICPAIAGQRTVFHPMNYPLKAITLHQPSDVSVIPSRTPLL